MYEIYAIKQVVKSLTIKHILPLDFELCERYSFSYQRTCMILPSQHLLLCKAPTLPNGFQHSRYFWCINISVYLVTYLKPTFREFPLLSLLHPSLMVCNSHVLLL